MNDNVQRFPGATALPDNPMELAPRRPGWCNHNAVTLDEHTRTVTCADPKCGAVLDPFNFLASNAHTIQRAWSAYRQAMTQANEIAERSPGLLRLWRRRGDGHHKTSRHYAGRSYPNMQRLRRLLVLGYRGGRGGPRPRILGCLDLSRLQRREAHESERVGVAKISDD